MPHEFADPYEPTPYAPPPSLPLSQRNPQCFGHTWYLGDDMMYFLTVPWLVVLYHQGGLRKTLSILLTLGVVVGCMTYNG